MHGVASNVSPSSGFRFVCYCNDCQAYARFLDRPDVLDPAGGTDIFHMPPAHVKFTAGTDALRCLRFSSRVLRWYTDCCRTPVANTAAWPGFPVVGIVHCFMDHAADGRAGDEALGPPHLRTLCGRAAAAERARSGVCRAFRPPRVKIARLVAARPQPAYAFLRRSDEGAPRRTARAHAK